MDKSVDDFDVVVNREKLKEIIERCGGQCLSSKYEGPDKFTKLVFWKNFRNKKKVHSKFLEDS